MTDGIDASRSVRGRGKLVVVGTGIDFASHLTAAARSWIERADKVFFVVSDPAAAAWLSTINPSAETLRLDRFSSAVPRTEVYLQMAEHLVGHVRQGLLVCAAFFGHPGMLVAPAHEAIRLARSEGLPARLLPAVSAQDCLFADLEIDPGETGWHSFDATDFLMNSRHADPASALVLWQIGMVGNPYYQRYDAPGLMALAERLKEIYAPDHQIVLYEAAVTSTDEPRIEHVRLDKLADARVTAATTLYAPPKIQPSLDSEMLLRLASEYANRSAGTRVESADGDFARVLVRGLL